MLRNDIPRSSARGPGHLVNVLMVAIALIAVIAWGITHRPVRRREGAPPPTVSVAQTAAATPPLSATAIVPRPTFGPNDVMVYTLDGQEVCTGYPLSNLGYHLRCAVPAGARLFRVVDAVGKATLAVRYNEQVLVRVGPQ